MLCCAHLDKTFVAGAKRMADWQQLSAFDVEMREGPPPKLKADCYQKIPFGKTEVWAYLPTEFAQSAYLLGAKYQTTELTAEQAISAMQELANNICMLKIGVGFEIVVLKFLREELLDNEKTSNVQGGLC